MQAENIFCFDCKRLWLFVFAVFVLKGKYTSLTETSTEYVEFRLFNTYLDGENLAYSDESAGIGYLKKDDIEKYSSYLDDEDYKVTKIQ